MCAPAAIAIATLAISAGTAAAGYISQKNEANRVQTENQQYYDANKKAATEAAMLNEHELSLRESENLLASGTQQGDVSRQEQQNVSTATVSAAEAGVSGNSLDAVLNDIQMQAGRQRERIQTNADLENDQLQREKNATLVQGRNNIALVRKTNVRGPSILTPILQVAGTGIQTYDYYQQRNAQSRQGNNG